MELHVSVRKDGPSRFAWAVYVDGRKLLGGLTRTDARRWKWEVIQESNAARERITGQRDVPSTRVKR